MNSIRVFISYRHEDSRHQVGRLYDRLKARFGASRVFRDVDSIPPGLDFREILTERVATCDVFLAVIGDAWLSVVDSTGKRRLDDADDFVRIEIEAALRRKIPVIPVLVGSGGVPLAAELPESLRPLAFRQIAPIRSDPDFHTDIDRLIDGIERAVAEATQNSGPEEIPTPDWFGRYRILRRLGNKTRGSVFLAEDPQLQRRVALKIPDFGPGRQTQARLRFLADARSLSAFIHPQLCPVLESGEIDGRPYLAMDFIDGKSLDRTNRPGGLPPRQVAALVGKLALAMQEVHQAGVIHGNLKPANIVFRGTRHRHDSVIVDFGHVESDAGTYALSGEFEPGTETSGYLAPEQIHGDRDAVGPACDIFALGVILYELLVGEQPPPISGWAAAGGGPSVAASTYAPPQGRLDPALRTICSRAMATEVNDRYPNMGEFASALARFLRSPSSHD
jgi:hypothetical protein